MDDDISLQSLAMNNPPEGHLVEGWRRARTRQNWKKAGEKQENT